MYVQSMSSHRADYPVVSAEVSAQDPACVLHSVSKLSCTVHCVHYCTPFSCTPETNEPIRQVHTDSRSTGTPPGGGEYIDGNQHQQNTKTTESSRGSEVTEDHTAQPPRRGTGRYPYMCDLLDLAQHRPSRPVHMSARCRAVVTPFIAESWQRALQHHPDRCLVDYIMRGLAEGFHIGYDYTHSCRSATQNMTSALQNPQPVKEYLEAEVQAGRVIGPLAQGEVQPLQISRFDVIPKSGQPGKWRLILDLSHPDGLSVNDSIDSQLSSMRYTHIDDAVKLILGLGQETYMAKVDIEQAYRNIPVHPQDRNLLGMQWEDKVFVDGCLPFGLRSAPKLFSAVADVLEWILQQAGVETVVHYLDDFLVMGKEQQCAESLRRTIQVCNQLGVPLKSSKVEGPAKILTFLGIELDTTEMEVRLPQQKLADLKAATNQWLGRRRCRKRELLSLIGKLAHVCKVIVAGRTFLRRMINLSTRRRNLEDWVTLNQEFRSDLAWWHMFMEEWNARGMMELLVVEWEPDEELYTDASGSWGCGALATSEWFQCPWDACWGDQSIAAKELLPIVMACVVWGPRWSRKGILVHCDNMAVVHIMQSKTSRDPVIMHLLRCLFFVAAHYELRVRAVHVAGVGNVAADALSRNLLQVFFRVSPGANTVPTPIPPPLWQLLVVQRPDWLSPTWRRLLRSCLSTVSPSPQLEHTSQLNEHTSDSATQ